MQDEEIFIPHYEGKTFALISACIESKYFNENFVEISFKNKQNYCDQYDDTFCYFQRKNKEINEISTKWNKLTMILETLRKTEHDYVTLCFLNFFVLLFSFVFCC